MGGQYLEKILKKLLSIQGIELIHLAFKSVKNSALKVNFNWRTISECTLQKIDEKIQDFKNIELTLWEKIFFSEELRLKCKFWHNIQKLFDC